MYSLVCPHILHTELWITVIYLLLGESQENQCMLFRACSNSLVIFKCSVRLEFPSGLFFWCDIMNFFVFLEPTSSFPSFSCTWLEFDVYNVCSASLCSAQLQYNVCVCVCVCAQAHTGERFLEKQKQNRFSFYANLSDCSSLDKVWHIRSCFMWTVTITWL